MTGSLGAFLQELVKGHKGRWAALSFGLQEAFNSIHVFVNGSPCLWPPWYT